MFGYVNINKQELKVKEYYKYKAYYCGLCHQLKRKYGRFGQMTLTYDMTFLIIVLTSLYECEVTHEKKRCLAHPTVKHDMIMNEISDYAADMNIALTYHKLLDDWSDDHSLLSVSGAKLLKRRYRKIERRYPKKCEKIRTCLEQLAELEKSKEVNIDLITRPFGELMGELFVYREDQWKGILFQLGFFLGKYIYLLDAYDDLERDIQSGSYNPIEPMRKNEFFEQEIYQILMLMMSECTKEFEKLPLLWDAELLRNILYAGVWKKYDDKKTKLVKERKET
jgi:hypothetical protein